jgi:glutathione S-transferase
MTSERSATMLRIWGRKTSSNVQKVLWCCGELDIPFERVDVGGPFGGNKDVHYLELNPNGLVPTIQDGDLVLWESNTICRYLAATHNGERLYPPAPAERADVERWMDWQLSTIGPPMGVLLYGLIRSKPEARDHASIEAARRKAFAAWAIIEDALESAPFLTGSGLSLAEIVMGTLVYRWHAFPIERPPLPRLKAWYERMRERPAFRMHIEIPIT